MPRAKRRLKAALALLHESERKKRQAQQKQAHAQQRAEEQRRKRRSEKGELAQSSKRGGVRRFTLEDHILCVGEGNFSFAHALAGILASGYPIVATAFDSEEVTSEKYPDSPGFVEKLREYGATVLFGIDATRLEKYKALRNQKFTKIVFNFPHTGSGITDQDRNVRANQELLLSFFSSAAGLLATRAACRAAGKPDETDGEILVTLKSGKPYDLWQIKDLGKRARPAPGLRPTARLVCKTSFAFDPALYPGYEHRRTIGFAEGVSAAANEEIVRCDGKERAAPRTYVFALAGAACPGDCTEPS